MNIANLNCIIQEARVALLNNKCNEALKQLNLLQIELDLNNPPVRAPKTGTIIGEEYISVNEASRRLFNQSASLEKLQTKGRV
jgi:hypothetical protein